MKTKLQIISESVNKFIKQQLSQKERQQLPPNPAPVMLGTEVEGTEQRGLHKMTPGMVYDPKIELDAQGKFIMPAAWRIKKPGETKGAFRPTIGQSLSDAAPVLRMALHQSGFYKNNPAVSDPT